MGFIELQNLDINKNYTARDIDLITFKDILAKMETFTNTLKGNIEYLKVHGVDKGIPVVTTLDFDEDYETVIYIEN